MAAVPDLPGHVEMLRRYLFVLKAQADRLDDLVPEVFAVALKKELQDRAPAALGAFLRGVAKNMLLRKWQYGARTRNNILAR
ncbi:MAG: DNA-directed RNA polymerase specialized sigma24 family protein [Neolewinella sp.]